MQDLIADLMNLFQLFAGPPFAPILIIMVSVSVSTISNLGMRRFSDMRRLKRYQAEIKQHQEMQKEAEKTQNAKLLKRSRDERHT